MMEGIEIGMSGVGNRGWRSLMSWWGCTLPLPFSHQGKPLVYARSVLFVDDDQGRGAGIPTCSWKMA